MTHRHQLRHVMFLVSAITSITTISVAFAQELPTAPAESLAIFGPGQKDTVRIPFQKCNSKSAQHGVKIAGPDEKPHIRWRWEDKHNSWCGWGLQGLPTANLEPYVGDGVLIIHLSGDWAGPAPEVKFMDATNASSKLVSVQRFLSGNPSSTDGATIKIPLKQFKMDWSIDQTNVMTLQFDAAYESSNGDIQILSISLQPAG